MNAAHVLVVDDEPAMLENCARILTRTGCTCHTLSDPLQFRDEVERVDPEVVILDLRMPAVDGMTLLAAALADDASLPVVIITAYGSIASAVEAIREGAFDYLTKPFTADQLIVATERAVRYRRLTVENRELREQVAGQPHGFLGSSPEIVRLLEQVDKVARTDANVLVTGESGTGKELIGRIIHDRSPRGRTGSFIPVDCAALPEGLLESELFGYTRGAFTGAVASKKGLLAEADGGTVFLDEVAELGPSLQSKLLRTLEERKVRRLGDSVFTDVDIRVIAATNADLERGVDAGTFRRDLYYRLHVIRFHIPPLRSRPGDLPMLLHHFLDQFATMNKKCPPRVASDVWRVLERHSWPGNVREVRNLAERLVVLDDDGLVTRADLPAGILAAYRRPARPGDGPMNYQEARTEAVVAFRATYVPKLLAMNAGNVSRAARAAGVSRRTLHRWIAELRETEPGEPDS